MQEQIELSYEEAADEELTCQLCSVRAKTLWRASARALLSLQQGALVLMAYDPFRSYRE